MSAQQPYLLVPGGSGFLGRHICRIAVEAGCRVTSITRSGRPTGDAAWMQSVDWVAADIFDPASWADHLAGCDAVIHCVGTLTEDPAVGLTHARTITESTCRVSQAATDAGVPRFVYVSASSAPPGAPASYMEAKHTAENCLARRPMQVVILRPSLIYGEDQPQSMKDKAQMDRLRNIPFVGRRIEAVRPLAVDLVARAGVRSALDPSVAGILDIPAIEQLAEAQPA